MASKNLPIINSKVAESALQVDGTRKKVVPADVRGRFIWARRAVFALLIAVWAGLPWLKIKGNPALFIDVPHRRFYIFGATFNSQDIWLVFFLMTGTAFALVVTTSLLGRVWCGWACPQTVFMESFFRPIERLIGGPREKRLRRSAESGFDAVWRGILTHVLFLAAALVVAHIFVSYFVSLPALWAMMHQSPGEHPEAFGWMVALTVLFYANFAHFREQLCVVVCPYGRLQSVLLDDDSLVIGYDEKRGEPRGKAAKAEKSDTAEKAEPLGDCVDCKRCVVVCPTGIDIRNGLQIDCVACTQCIDACDEIMDKLKRPRGLVRYDSLRGLRHEKKRILRPRLAVYAVLGVAGLVAATLAFRRHQSFEASMFRVPGAPFVRENGQIRNSYTVHLVNKQAQTETFLIEPFAQPGYSFNVPTPEVSLESMSSRSIPVVVTMPQADYHGDTRIKVKVVHKGGTEVKELSSTFLGAR
ncbi:MAG: cytochrome c oxidase accessory protein CcoG [Myxococcales bacterium]|jgi:cytochrome c oxidase accessory protein FixG|nr:cytochrome c oxidase accessory protein CcoG [Myxococcales bacterium]